MNYNNNFNKQIYQNSLFNYNYSTATLSQSLAEIISQDISSKLHDLISMSDSARFKTIMEILMKAERAIHLENSISDKANGYMKRKLNTSMGQIELNVPRDRNGDFRPSVLPPKYQRFDDSYLNLINAGINNFYSQSGIRDYLNNLNLPYSKEQLDKLSEKIYEEYQIWKERELPEDVIAIFVDGYHTELYEEEAKKVVKAVVYLVIGIDFKGEKDLYAIEFITGNENKDSWMEVFNKLISRGLKRPLIVISDDFRGIDEAVKTLFPNALHQLCWTHFRRNVRRNMGKKPAKEFSQFLEKLKLEKDFEIAKSKFMEYTEKFKEKYPGYISYIQKKHELFLCFFRFDVSVRKHFYTTNIVESFNNILGIIERNSGGFFRSKKMLELNCYIKRNQLKTKKWSKPAPNIKANIYYLIQMFGRIYGENPKIN